MTLVFSERRRPNKQFEQTPRQAVLGLRALRMRRSSTATRWRNTKGARVVAEPGGYVVGCGTLALINAGFAQGKNRSGLAWFFLSLLLGPLATVILLLMEKLPSKP